MISALEKIFIPKTVESIGPFAFAGCKKLIFESEDSAQAEMIAKRNRAKLLTEMIETARGKYIENKNKIAVLTGKIDALNEQLEKVVEVDVEKLSAERQKYKELKDKKAELEEDLRNCENYLKDLLGENESGYIDDLKVTWKTIKSNRVDSKILKEKYPEIYDECCFESSCRKFGIKYPKSK